MKQGVIFAVALLIGLAALLLLPESSAQQTAAQTTAALQIVFPPNGTVVAPGARIDVEVRVAPNMTFPNGVNVVGKNVVNISEILTSPPYRFTLEVSEKAGVGKTWIFATGSSLPGQFITSAPVSLSIENTERPAEIRVTPEQLPLDVVGAQIPLNVIGLFQDGAVRDVTRSSITTYQSSDANVVHVNAEGLVTAIGPGSAVIIVRHGTVSFDVRVSVPDTMVGDLDGDGDVDQDDVNVILSALNMPARSQYDPRDLDRDRKITTLDARKLVLLCTRPRCAVQ